MCYEVYNMLPLNKAKCCETVEQGFFFFKILSSVIKEKGERLIKSLCVTPERMYKVFVLIVI